MASKSAQGSSMYRTASYFLVTAVALASAIATGAAQAQGRMAQRLQSLDTNGDGSLSRVEAQAHPGLARRFDEIDANHDGQLSREELMAFHAAHPRGEHGAKLFER